MKICEYCGGENKRKSVRAIYCSDSCKRKANDNKSEHKKTKWRADKINTCKECGKQFKPSKNTPFAKFCGGSCRNKNRSRRWRKNNPEKAKEKVRRYDKSEKRKQERKRNYETYKKYQYKWRSENPEKAKEIRKRHYHSGGGKEYMLKWKKHTTKGKLLNRKNSLLRRPLDVKIEKRNFNHSELKPILEEQNYKCPICGEKYDGKLENMELGHIFPVSKNPLLVLEIENILPICKDCNRSMQNMKFSEFCKKKGVPIPKRAKEYEDKIKKRKKITEYHQN